MRDDSEAPAGRSLIVAAQILVLLLGGGFLLMAVAADAEDGRIFTLARYFGIAGHIIEACLVFSLFWLMVRAVRGKRVDPEEFVDPWL